MQTPDTYTKQCPKCKGTGSYRIPVSSPIMAPYGLDDTTSVPCSCKIRGHAGFIKDTAPDTFEEKKMKQTMPVSLQVEKDVNKPESQRIAEFRKEFTDEGQFLYNSVERCEQWILTTLAEVRKETIAEIYKAGEHDGYYDPRRSAAYLERLYAEQRLALDQMKEEK